MALLLLARRSPGQYLGHCERSGGFALPEGFHRSRTQFPVPESKRWSRGRFVQFFNRADGFNPACRRLAEKIDSQPPVAANPEGHQRYAKIRIEIPAGPVVHQLAPASLQISSAFRGDSVVRAATRARLPWTTNLSSRSLRKAAIVAPERVLRPSSVRRESKSRYRPVRVQSGQGRRCAIATLAQIQHKKRSARVNSVTETCMVRLIFMN